MTPTFATGLGVVVAAVLAYQMGAPTFRVSAPSWAGQPCVNLGCSPAPGGTGPASVTGGKRLQAPAPAGTAGAQPGQSGAPRERDEGPRPVQPAVTYRTERVWPGHFQGSLTVSFAAGHIPRHWRLRFSYPAGRIQRVWGPVTWQPAGEHTAGVASRWTGHTGRGHAVQIWFDVDGHPGRPASCSLNGVACAFQ